jgi:hypothetical protein
MSNAKAIPIACLGAVVFKHPLIPVSLAGNWGQRPVLESILPLMFGCDELRRVGDSHGPEEIRW